MFFSVLLDHRSYQNKEVIEFQCYWRSNQGDQGGCGFVSCRLSLVSLWGSTEWFAHNFVKLGILIVLFFSNSKYWPFDSKLKHLVLECFFISFVVFDIFICVISSKVKDVVLWRRHWNQTVTDVNNTISRFYRETLRRTEKWRTCRVCTCFHLTKYHTR